MGPGQTEPDPGFLGVFAAAAETVLREMAGLDAAARPTAAADPPHCEAQLVSAVIPLGGEGYLVLCLPRPAASALAVRVLGVTAEPDGGMTRDCVGEVANVIAGQAKALLRGTPGHFRFSTPVVADGPPAVPAGGAEAVVFDTAVGEIHMSVRRPGGSLHPAPGA